MRAQVLFGTNNIFTVVGEDQRRYLCRIKGKRLAGTGQSHAPLAPGDWVQIRAHDADKGLIERRLPRTNVLRRQGKRVGEQVMAANIDQLLVMAAVCEPRPLPELINRFLLLGRDADVPTFLLLNKVDLVPAEDLDFLRFRWRREFCHGQVGLLFSSVTGWGEDEWRRLAEQFAGRTTAVIGASGVGKSSLINRLLGLPLLATSALSASGRGTHTTTRATMVEGSGWRLIDTPGISSLIPLVALRQLARFFPEFQPHLGQCQFSSCHHLNEPGCAVKEAVKFGAIPPARYQCYQRIHAHEEGYGTTPICG